MTPLPAASPSAFTTIGAPASSAWARAAAAAVKRRQRAVATPAAAATSFMKLLEPSSLAAAAEGPRQAMPASSMRSAMPATSGASGPGTTKSMALARAQASRPSMSAAPIATGSASAAMPSLPGAQ